MVDIDWKDGQVSYLKIKSNLGGNCRLRLMQPLTSRGAEVLGTANGSNPNPFYAIAEIQKPRVAESAPKSALSIAPGTLYDFNTQTGKVYEFIKQ